MRPWWGGVCRRALQPVIAIHWVLLPVTRRTLHAVVNDDVINLDDSVGLGLARAAWSGRYVMTVPELQTRFQGLPAMVREKVDTVLSDAAIALKLRIAEFLADKEEQAEHAVTTAGRVGAKSGEVSELTVLMPLKPNGAERLRKFFKLVGGNLAGAGQVGTLHNMRFVFLKNDTKLLFATAYDGEWDPYIDDFATKIPEFMDYLFSNVEGWPGITSPDVKDFIVQYQWIWTTSRLPCCVRGQSPTSAPTRSSRSSTRRRARSCCAAWPRG